MNHCAVFVTMVRQNTQSIESDGDGDRDSVDGDGDGDGHRDGHGHERDHNRHGRKGRTWRSQPKDSKMKGGLIQRTKSFRCYVRASLSIYLHVCMHVCMCNHQT